MDAGIIPNNGGCSRWFFCSLQCSDQSHPLNQSQALPKCFVLFQGSFSTPSRIEAHTNRKECFTSKLFYPPFTTSHQESESEAQSYPSNMSIQHILPFSSHRRCFPAAGEIWKRFEDTLKEGTALKANMLETCFKWSQEVPPNLRLLCQTQAWGRSSLTHPGLDWELLSQQVKYTLVVVQHMQNWLSEQH